MAGISKAIELGILSYIFIQIVINIWPVAFNSTAITSFTIWGTSYLSLIGVIGVITFFLALWLFLKGSMSGLGSK